MLGQLGMQGLASAGIIGTGGIAQQQYQSNQNAYMALQQSSYNQQMMLGQMAQQQYIKPRWVFDGTTYNSAREMADTIWPVSCPQKTHFLLKYE